MVDKATRDRLRALLDAASPRPWRAAGDLLECRAKDTKRKMHWWCIGQLDNFNGAEQDPYPDAALTAAAINALPDLLDALDAALARAAERLSERDALGASIAGLRETDAGLAAAMRLVERARDAALTRATAAEARAQTLEDALRWYEDETTHRVPPGEGWSPADRDMGDRARRALAAHAGVAPVGEAASLARAVAACEDKVIEPMPDDAATRVSMAEREVLACALDDVSRVAARRLALLRDLRATVGAVLDEGRVAMVSETLGAAFVSAMRAASRELDAAETVAAADAPEEPK